MTYAVGVEKGYVAPDMEGVCFPVSLNPAVSMVKLCN